jgi:hypothetical protein
MAALDPFLVMAAVDAADIGAGPGLGFLPLLSLGPALAALWLSPPGHGAGRRTRCGDLHAACSV